MNSTLTGPTEGTGPPAAKRHNGENNTTVNINNFLLLLTKSDLK
jgi:hypothetical protein